MMRHPLAAHLLAAAASLGLAAPALAQDGLIERTLEKQLSTEDRIVQIDGFDGALSSEATIERIVVSDADGAWLTLEDVVIDWNRSALLRGRVEVERLSAALIEIPRAPGAGSDAPSAEATPFRLPELPVSVSIGEVSAGRVVLGEALAGRPAVIGVEGSLRLGGGEGEGRIVATRLDGPGGEFRIAAGYSNASEILSVDVRIAEPEGGVIATALNLPGQPSILLAVAGEGPLSEFDATLTLATDGTERLAGALSLAGTSEAGRAFRADISGDIAPLLFAEYQDFFGADVRLAVAGTRAPDGVLTLPEITLRAAQLELAGSVTVGADGLPDLIDLQGAIVDAEGGPVRLPVAGAPTLVDRADLAIAFDAAEGETWTGTVALSGLSRPGFEAERIALDGSGVIVGGEVPRVTADLDIVADALDLGSAEAREALGERVTARAAIDWEQGQPVRIDGLTVAGESYALSGAAAIVLGTPPAPETVTAPEAGEDPDAVVADDTLRVTLDLAVEARDLTVFAGIAQRPLSGRIDADVAGALRPLSGMFDLALDGSGEDIRVGIAEVDALLEGTARFGLAAARDPGGTHLRRLRIASDGVTAEGEANIDNDQIAATLDATLLRTDVIAEGVRGPIEARIRAYGPRDDWAMTATVTGPGLSVAADAVVDPSGDAYAVTGSADLDIDDLAPFSGRAGRDLAGAVDGTVAGRVVADLSAFDVTLDVVTRGIVTGIAQADELLSGEARIAGAAVREGDTIRLPALTFESPALALDGTASVRMGADLMTPLGGMANVTATIRDTAILAPGLPGPVTAEIDADGEAGRWTVVSAFEGPGLSGRTDAAIDLSGPVPVVDGTVALDARDIAPFSDLAGRDLAGAVDATVTGRVVTDLSSFDAVIEATTRDLVTGIARVDAVLAGEATLRADADRAGQTVTIDAFRFASPQLLAEATGTVTLEAGGYLPEAADLTATATVRDTAIVAPGLPGPVDIALAAQGGGDRWDIDATLDGPDLDAVVDASVDLSGPAPAVAGRVSLDAADLAPLSDLAGRPLAGGVTLTAEGEAVTDLSRFDVTLDAATSNLVTGIARVDDLLDGRASLRADADRDGGDVTITDLRFDAPALTAAADGRVTLDGTTPTGGALTATATLRDTAILAPGLPGPVDVALSATGTGADWTVDGRIDGPNLDGTIDATADLSGPAPALDGTVTLASADIAPFSTLAGRRLSGGIEARAVGRIVTDLSAFDMTLNATTRALSVGQADADAILAGTATLAATARREGDAITVPSLRFESPALTVTAEGRTEGDSGSARFDARLADISRYAAGLPGPATVTGTASRGPGGWTIDVDGTGPGGINATAEGTIAPAFDRFDIAAAGAVPLEIANPFIAPLALAGTGRFDLRLNGAPALENVTGQVTTAGARFIAPTLGVSISDLGAAIALSGGRASLDISGQFIEGGRVAISGPVTLSGAFPADLTVALASATFSDPSLYTTQVNGTITVRGPLTGGALIGGQLALDETEIRIPSGAVGGANPIPDLIHVNEPTDVRRTRERAGLIEDPAEAGSGDGGGPAFPLDLTIVAENRIFLRGRGLEAELGGTIRLTGTTQNVIPAGRFELVRGRLDILGQRLTLDEGFVNLQGDFNPYVQLVAATDSDGTLIRIVLQGLASEPDILFLSEPDLPDDEVLARLLFGRSIEDLSPLQAAQLAAAVATLAGRGGEGLVSRLRQDFGLDDLDVTTTDGGGVGVRAGKYISENVYTDVLIDSEGQAEVSINLDLTPSVTVRGAVDNVGQSGVGVFFERDY